MDAQRQDHLQELRRILVARLEVLELQAARMGYDTPPHVITQIREIKEEVADIGRQLQGLPQPGEPAPAQASTAVLFLAADPSDAVRLRLGEELREIHEKLQLARLRDRFVLESRWSVRPQDISQALLDVRPQVVHFSGHGTTAGELRVEDGSGKTHSISADALATLFESFREHVSCVILNACFSAPQATAIARHIPYVIGMDRAIGDRAAIAFSVGFYQALGAGRTIEDAFKLGRSQIMLMNIPQEMTPVLIKQDAVAR